MSDYGISVTGFKRKRLDQIKSELDDSFKGIFGDNFNLSPESPDGQINGVISEAYANLWEILERAYDAYNPSSATGVDLSNLVQINGITRLPPSFSRAQVNITGADGTVIPSGSLVSTTDTNDQFATENDVTISGGVASVFVSALNSGPISALANTIEEIDTPITGWYTVTNPSPADVGTNEESDVDLRVRRQRSVANGSQSILDSIYAAVADIDGVTQTVVLENDTDSVDANGLPAHSFQVVVVGGADADIAEQIWLNKPAGITSFGTETESVLDSQGISHDISFSRPTTVDIYVEVTLSTDSTYPANGDDLIKQAIVDYANGDLVEGRGFSLAEDVIYTRLYTPLNSIQGHSISDLKIGTSPSPTGTVDIPIATTEISNFLVANILVSS